MRPPTTSGMPRVWTSSGVMARVRKNSFSPPNSVGLDVRPRPGDHGPEWLVDGDQYAAVPGRQVGLLARDVLAEGAQRLGQVREGGHDERVLRMHVGGQAGHADLLGPAAGRDRERRRRDVGAHALVRADRRAEAARADRVLEQPLDRALVELDDLERDTAADVVVGLGRGRVPVAEDDGAVAVQGEAGGVGDVDLDRDEAAALLHAQDDVLRAGRVLDPAGARGRRGLCGRFAGWATRGAARRAGTSGRPGGRGRAGGGRERQEERQCGRRPAGEGHGDGRGVVGRGEASPGSVSVMARRTASPVGRFPSRFAVRRGTAPHEPERARPDAP